MLIIKVSRFVEKGLAVIWLTVAACLAVSLPASGSRRERDFFVACRLDSPSPYEREGALLTVNLYSVSPDVAYARNIVPPSLDKGEFSYISNVETPRSVTRETVDGRDYYVFVLNKYLVCLHDKGTYSLKGGEYNIGINVPEVYDDPFWGRSRRVRTEKFTLGMEPLRFKVRSLPEPDGESDFTGAVGEFGIETVVPPGDIVMNREATVIVTLKGKGLVGKDLLPEYRNAFVDGVRLKSISDSRDTYFDGEDVVSVVTLECEFIPTSRDAEIGRFSFCFFNPATGRYETVKSRPVKVEVKSLTSKVETQEV